METEKSKNKRVQKISHENIVEKIETTRKEIEKAIDNRKPSKRPKWKDIFIYLGTPLAVVSLVLSALSIRDAFLIPEKIYVASAPFNVQDRRDVEHKYIDRLELVNNLMRKKSFTCFFSEKYAFVVDVPDTYEEVFEKVSNGKVQMAFISHAIFNCKIDSIDCSDFDTINRKKREDSIKITGKEPVKLIGFKKEKDSLYYYSYLIWNKKHNIKKIEGIIEKIKKDSVLFRLGPALSVSTHLVPELFFKEKEKEKKYDIRAHKEGEETDRRKMISEIFQNTEGKIIIGALSNEDYEMLDKEGQPELIAFKIEQKIPYDAILVNSKWWDKLGKTGKKIIKNSLKESSKDKHSVGMIDKNEDGFLEHCVAFRDSLKSLGEYCLPKDK